jgi:hypothetical protein
MPVDGGRETAVLDHRPLPDVWALVGEKIYYLK